MGAFFIIIFGISNPLVRLKAPPHSW